jgi:hypothetical protein
MAQRYEFLKESFNVMKQSTPVTSTPITPTAYCW